MSRSFRKVFVDLETSGLDPNHHEILEVALIKDNGETYLTKITPQHPERFSEEALKVNGYSPDAWANANSLPTALSQIKEFLKEKDVSILLVAHNAKFDYGFLEAVYKQNNIKQPFSYHTIDTVTLALEHLVPLGLDKLSLKDVCRFLSIEPEPDVHSALNGAKKCQEVYDKITNLSWFDKMNLKRRNKK
jgi:DNA polymerase-3 subunit epsilon